MVAEAAGGTVRPRVRLRLGPASGIERMIGIPPVCGRGVSTIAPARGGRPQLLAERDSLNSLEPWYDSSSEGKAPLRTSAAYLETASVTMEPTSA